MAEGSEHRRTTRNAARPKGEIVPTGDPDHEVRTATDEPQDPLAFIKRAQDVLTVKRVYGEPIERNGVTIIPAVSLSGGGGGGGGGGQNGEQRGSGWGGGFGVGARPAGAYIIRSDGRVVWRPALDLDRTIFMGQLVAIVALLTLRSVVRAIAKRR